MIFWHQINYRNKILSFIFVINFKITNMKKLLLFAFFIVGFLKTYAQSDCANAIAITTNGTISAPAVDGVFSNNCYNHTLDSNGGTIFAIWYSFTPTSNGEVTITSNLANNVAPFSVDTKVSIFTGTCASLICYDANDDSSSTKFLSTITFPVQSGVTYYIAWDNYWDANGFDFDFNFTPSSCVKLYYFNAISDLTTTSATLNWTASVSSPPQYQVEYGLYGFTQGSGTTVLTPTNSVTLSGLNANANYQYYIRGYCDATNQSSWSAVKTLALVKACPFACTFDDGNQVAGWTTSGNGAYGIGATAANAQGGVGQYWIMNNSTTIATNNWLFTPPVTLAANESVTVSFWTRCGTARSFRLTAGIAATPAAQTTQIWSNTTLLNTTYSQTTAPEFVAPVAGIYYFAFNDISPIYTTGSAQNLRLDTINFSSVLGTNGFTSSNFFVYPNPTNGIINISNDVNTTVSAIEILDLNGRIVKSQSNQINENQISISELSAGVYMLKLSTSQGVISKKIVKN